MNECVREIKAKSGTYRMIKRYKRLIHEAPIEHRIVAGKRAAVILSVFDEKLNPQLSDNDKKFDQKLAATAVTVLDRFQQVIDKLPELIEDYVETITRLGGMNKPVYRENITPFIYTLDGIIKRWIVDPEDDIGLDMLKIRFDVLQESVGSAISMIDFFNKEHIYTVKDGVPVVFGTKRNVIAVYLVRAVSAVYYNPDDDNAHNILEGFRQLDERVKNKIRNMENGKSEYANELIDMNERMGILIGYGKTDMEEVLDIAKMYGIEPLRERIMGMSPYGK